MRRDPEHGGGTAWRRLAVIAGGGPLPVRIAQAGAACAGEGEPPFIIRLTGCADSPFDGFDTAECGLGEAGRLIRLLKEAGCDAVVLAGLVARPDFAALKLDMRGASLLPRVVAAAARGDGALLDILVRTLEQEGFRVLGAQDIVGGLLARQGAMGDHRPLDDHHTDIKKAAALINAIGPFDVGQGAIVARGLVLAIEAAEGTDAMLARCAGLPEALRGQQTARAGVLVKRPKPGQELRVDLPTIGVETINGADRAGLAGVAFEAGGALIMDADATIGRANACGLFLFGFGADDLL